MLARKDALVIRDGRLHCASPRHDADLRKAVSNASRGTAPASEIVIHRDERRPLLLRLIPSRGAQLAALFGGAVLAVRIKDPDREASPPPAQLAQLFGLTPSEAKAVLATARASSQGEAARHLGRAKTTLRTHLHHAYQKLGVHDPAEMVRLLAAYGFAQSPDQP
ncbi:MAG: hypothetical protein JO047_17025 [Alphaproteobacteria bacterium]|nr:hypothetical protein [Alphaproteobacteria bacterium]